MRSHLVRHGDAPDLPSLGVLYLDRREDRPCFSVEDEQWARDFAAISERLLTLIELLARARREREAALADNDALRSEQFGAELDVLASRDPAFQDHVGRVLAKAAKADRVTVLLQGPTGSGKTHLARRFHSRAAAANGPL
ncbi:MAG: sigma 54-interacting transcriptional regulator [Rhodanobacteraceae bacterium]|nr:sigma 54-interacting transcriptional regulator [Rhodanobacteraceae bacterium]